MRERVMTVRGGIQALVGFSMFFCALGLCVTADAAPTQSDLTVSFEVTTLHDDVTVRLYRLVFDRMSLIAEVDLEPGQSMLSFRDNPARPALTTYELHWVTKNGREYFIGRAGQSTHVEPSNEVVTSNPVPQALCPFAGLQYQIAEYRGEEISSLRFKKPLLNGPKPPP